MARTFRKATAEDLDRIMQLIECGRQKMRQNGNTRQWADGQPSRETLSQDIAIGNSYLLEEDGMPIATFALAPGPDATYQKICQGEWLNDEPYYVVHRMASMPGKHHVFGDVLDYGFTRTGNIRIDTHRDNATMRHLILKYGFHYCGIIHLADGTERLAYQKTTTSGNVTSRV
ncbi:GNAT family acetyltransferase [Prevotella sp. oral taxon 376]|uniref:GNAT family acetyltransferase n=1 Tax=Prevotella sp. oral taxon 376 TaxID=712466 RepID=UPI000D1F6DEB|nr:GNAT family acetyltransferase [Prevotella sp. oral taxon 376]PTL32921.1 GNAT family acetyltransferase [Prevotella sp. oral taxon 376]